MFLADWMIACFVVWWLASSYFIYRAGIRQGAQWGAEEVIYALEENEIINIDDDEVITPNKNYKKK